MVHQLLVLIHIVGCFWLGDGQKDLRAGCGEKGGRYRPTHSFNHWLTISPNLRRQDNIIL